MLGTTGSETGKGVAIDSNNNVYITGSTRENLDGNTITNQGFHDIFLIKYDSDGDKKWTKTFGGMSYDISQGVVIVSNNNYVYIAGTTYGDLDGNTNLGIIDTFLTQYDSDGDKKWTKTIGTTTNKIVYGYSVAIDSNNAVYITGYFTVDSLDGNTNQGSRDVFLTKFG